MYVTEIPYSPTTLRLSFLQSRRSIIGGSLVGHMKPWAANGTRPSRIPNPLPCRPVWTARDPEVHRYLNKTRARVNFFRGVARLALIIERLITRSSLGRWEEMRSVSFRFSPWPRLLSYVCLALIRSLAEGSTSELASRGERCRNEPEPGNRSCYSPCHCSTCDDQLAF